MLILFEKYFSEKHPHARKLSIALLAAFTLSAKVDHLVKTSFEANPEVAATVAVAEPPKFETPTEISETFNATAADRLSKLLGENHDPTDEDIQKAAAMVDQAQKGYWGVNQLDRYILTRTAISLAGGYDKSGQQRNVERLIQTSNTQKIDKRKEWDKIVYERAIAALKEIKTAELENRENRISYRDTVEKIIRIAEIASAVHGKNSTSDVILEAGITMEVLSYARMITAMERPPGYGT